MPSTAPVEIRLAAASGSECHANPGGSWPVNTIITLLVIAGTASCQAIPGFHTARNSRCVP